MKVKKSLFPINFLVTGIKEDGEFTLILDIPIIKTTQLMIDVDNGQMKISVQDEEVSFNFFEAMKHSKDDENGFKIHAIEEDTADMEK